MKRASFISAIQVIWIVVFGASGCGESNPKCEGECGEDVPCVGEHCETDEDEAHCEPITPTPSLVIDGPAVPSLGARLTFTCASDDYVFEGPTSLVCGADGRWSDKPPVCQWKGCTEGEQPLDGDPDSGVCEPCPANYFSDERGLMSCVEATPCPPLSAEYLAATTTEDRVCFDSSATQWGSSSHEFAGGLAVDADGSVFIVGSTAGTLGTASGGLVDAFIQKVSTSGKVLWTFQFGAGKFTTAYDVAIHTDGSVYVAGDTDGDLGEPSQGDSDAYIRKLNTDGETFWTVQFGEGGRDVAHALGLNAAGEVYVAGSFEDESWQHRAFIRKYDAAGGSLWARLFTGDAEQAAANALVVDEAGAAYVAGDMFFRGDTPSSNQTLGFIRKYSSDGLLLWERLIGEGERGEVVARALALSPSGGIYVAGDRETHVEEGGGSRKRESFVMEYSPDGERIWSRTFGHDGEARVFAMQLSMRGELYVAGRVTGALPPEDNSGDDDAFVVKLSREGELAYVHRFGTAEEELVFALAEGQDGTLMLLGETSGALAGESLGGFDLFLIRLSPPSDASPDED